MTSLTTACLLWSIQLSRSYSFICLSFRLCLAGFQQLLTKISHCCPRTICEENKKEWYATFTYLEQLPITQKIKQFICFLCYVYIRYLLGWTTRRVHCLSWCWDWQCSTRLEFQTVNIDFLTRLDCVKCLQTSRMSTKLLKN